MSKKGGAVLQKDVPWRASSPAAKPIPKIHQSPLLRLPHTPYSDYALSLMKHQNPIGSGLGQEAIVEAAGPDCIVPGQTPPIKLLGLKYLKSKARVFAALCGANDISKNGIGGETVTFVFSKGDWYKEWEFDCEYNNFQVWPIDIDLKFMEPVGRELQLVGKFMDSAVELMNKSFIDR